MTTTIGKKGAGSPERVDAEGDVEPLPRDGDEVEIEVVRRGPQPDPGVGYPRGDSEGDLQMRVQIRAVDVVRGDPGMSKQLVEQDVSPGPISRLAGHRPASGGWAAAMTAAVATRARRRSAMVITPPSAR
jgi:hypothetical protein